MTVTLRVNGATHEVDADPSTPLIYVLRNTLGLTGVKLGCGLEQCGACTVIADSETALSCVKTLGEFSGKEITTVEGLATHPVGALVQQAFVAENAAQCGYCTPGMVSEATALLSRNANPSRAQTIEAMNSHLCRCGSHTRVLKAIARVAKEKIGEKSHA
jgi:aerobic-type carbon monoxide dehydrogenase small subunit (CoxS/CutS family)